MNVHSKESVRHATVRPNGGGRRSSLRAGTRAALASLLLLSACGPSPFDPPPPEHGDVLVASTEAGGGELAADFHADDPIPVFLGAMVAGSSLYSATDPGFAALEEDEPDEERFVLEDDVTVTIEITGLDDGVQLKIGSVVLDDVGDSAVLGTTPELHTHGEWQVVVPDDVTSGEFEISFRFTTDSPLYGPSDPTTVVLTLSDDPAAE